MDLARSSIKIFAANAGSSLLTFFGITFFARELGSHEIGVFFLFQAILGMLTIPADFGVRSGLTKRLSEGEPPGSLLSTAILLKGVLLLPIIIVIAVFSKPINSYIGSDVSFLLIAALVLQESARLAMQVLKGELRVGDTAGPMFARNVVYVGVGVVLVLTGEGIRGIIYGLFAGLVVMLAWGASKSSIPLGSPSVERAHSLFNYSKYAFVSSIGGYFYSWMDVAIIGLFLTQSDVGVYEIAWRITAVMMLVSSSVATTIFPQVSQWDAGGSAEQIGALLSKAIVPTLFLVIPAFFGTMVLSEEILGLVFGTEYSVGWLVLIILMGEKVIQSVHIILGRSLQGINRPDLAAKATIVSIFLNLVLNLAFILKYGIVGAAVATALSFTVNSILHAYYVSRFVPIRIPYVQISACIVASVGMSVVIYLFESTVIIDTIPMLISTIGLGMAVYIGSSLIIPPSRNVFLNTIQRVVDL